MGAFLEKPKTEKHNECGDGNGLRYGLASMQGWRIEMEDAHCAVTNLPGNLKDWSFFAVFDGHAGARVSAHCANQLLEAIMQTDELKRFDPEMVPSVEEVQNGIREGFLRLDEKLRKLPEVESGQDKSGSTAVCVLISPKHYFFANCGDSRGMLFREGQVFFSTIDHKPANPGERNRIISAGGNVMIQRVNGSLAVSRSLGDYDYKKVEGRGPTEQLVSPEPEITILSRDRSLDELIVLACDGVWDVMSNEDLLAYVNHRLKVSSDLTRVCNEVIDTCLYKGSRDNMSIVLIGLENAPQPDPDMTLRDRQLDEELRTHTQNFLEKNAQIDVEMTSLIKFINSLDLKDYPPGGILTKRHIIDDHYNEFLAKIKNNECRLEDE